MNNTCNRMVRSWFHYCTAVTFGHLTRRYRILGKSEIWFRCDL